MNGHTAYGSLELAWRLANEPERDSQVYRKCGSAIALQIIEAATDHTVQADCTERSSISQILFSERVSRDSPTMAFFLHFVKPCLTCFRNIFVFLQVHKPRTRCLRAETTDLA